MTIKEEAKQICEKRRKMLDRQSRYPVKQNNGAYEYQRHGLSYAFARELEGYIIGYAEALGIKTTNQTLIAVKDDYEIKYLLSIEFMDGRAY